MTSVISTPISSTVMLSCPPACKALSTKMLGASKNGTSRSTSAISSSEIMLVRPSLHSSKMSMQRENLASIRRKVGYIFQDSDSQLFMPTVAADVAFAAQNYGYPTEEVAARTHRALQQVHIEDCADRPVYRLSGGQKKLASIAGILTLDPELILMDEPSAALDPKNRRNLIEILRGLPCAMLIASHDLDFIYDTCDRVVLLYEGRIAADGPAEEILHDGALLADCDLELPLRFQSI